MWAQTEADTGLHTCLESWPGVCLFICVVCTGWRGWSWGRLQRKRKRGWGAQLGACDAAGMVRGLKLKELLFKGFVGHKGTKRLSWYPGDETWHRMGVNNPLPPLGEDTGGPEHLEDVWECRVSGSTRLRASSHNSVLRNTENPSPSGFVVMQPKSGGWGSKGRACGHHRVPGVSGPVCEPTVGHLLPSLES